MLVRFNENSVQGIYVVAHDYGAESWIEIIINYDDNNGESWGVLKDFSVDGLVEVDRFCPTEWVLEDIWARMFEGPCIYTGSSLRDAYACKLIEEAAISDLGDDYNPFRIRAESGVIRDTHI